MARTPEINILEDYQKNLIINGALDFWQRGTSVSFVTLADTYLADRFVVQRGSIVDVSGTIDQDTDVPLPIFKYSKKIEITSGTLNPTPESVDNLVIRHDIEGHEIGPVVTSYGHFSVWVKSNVTGTYSVSFRSGGLDRSYVTTYTIDIANVWQQVLIPVDFTNATDSGTWNYDENIGISISMTLMSGLSGSTSVKDTWQDTSDFYHTDQVNFAENAGNIFKFTGVQFVPGNEALPFRRSGRTIADELVGCQRFYAKSGGPTNMPTPGSTGFASFREHYAYNTNSVGRIHTTVRFPVVMRTVPTMTFWDQDYNENRISYITTTGGALLANQVVNLTGDESRMLVSIDDGANARQGIVGSWVVDAEYL